MVLLLGGLGGALHVDHLQSLHQHTLKLIKAGLLTVLGQQLIALGIGDIQPGRHGRRHGPEGVPVGDKAAQHVFPLLASGEVQDPLLDLREPALCLGKIQVLHIGAAGDRHAEAVVRLHRDALDVDAVLNVDGDKARIVDLRDAADRADGMKALGRQGATALLLLLHEDRDLFALDRSLAGQLPVDAAAQPEPRAGQGDHIV